MIHRGYILDSIVALRSWSSDFFNSIHSKADIETVLYEGPLNASKQNTFARFHPTPALNSVGPHRGILAARRECCNRAK